MRFSFLHLWLIMMGVLQDHILDLHQPGGNRRYVAYATGFLRTITRILLLLVSYHKKLVTFASYG